MCNYCWTMWLKLFNLEHFAKAINEMDPDLKFIIDEIKEETHVKLKTTDNLMEFDIYHKPTNTFGYLRYTSCHPAHTIKTLLNHWAKDSLG